MGLVLIGKVEVKMLPFDNKDELQIVLDLPEGSSLEKTRAVVGEIARLLDTRQAAGIGDRALHSGDIAVLVRSRTEFALMEPLFRPPYSSINRL